MSKFVCKGLYALSAAAVALQFLGSAVLAADTMSDWTGENSNPSNTTFTTVDPPINNNYGLISPTSVGGDIQAKITFNADPTVTAENPVDAHHAYFSDPTLEGPTLDFTTPLHMEGTITFNSPVDTEPNLLFGWYNSTDTRHRIGLGISNRSMSQGGAIANHLRVDFGYAATGGNSFHYVSPDGNTANTSPSSVVPNGTYPFTFDYTPGTPGDTDGYMQATIGTFFKTLQALPTQPWDLDFFTFDRFGFVQRHTSTTSATIQKPFDTYNLVFSNVDYTGGTEAAVTVPGDFNSSGAANAADLAIWQTNFGTGTTLATGDADGDGDADGNDFLIWQQNNSGGAITAIPEPAALGMLAVAAAALCLRGRRSRR